MITTEYYCPEVAHLIHKKLLTAGSQVFREWSHAVSLKTLQTASFEVDKKLIAAVKDN